MPTFNFRNFTKKRALEDHLVHKALWKGEASALEEWTRLHDRSHLPYGYYNSICASYFLICNWHLIVSKRMVKWMRYRGIN